MAYALGLPDALRRRGLTVEVVPGWETRSAGTFAPAGAVAHWTAGPRGATGRPSLNVVTYGRPGLDGPLCNVYGARDGTAVVVAAGRANHAGAGSWRGLVGNSSVFGTEMEGADATDFTAAQRWAYPHIHAAYCDLGGFGPEMNCGHSEWAGPRKQDINGYTPDVLRRDIAAVLANASEEFTVAQFDEIMAKLDQIRNESWQQHKDMANYNGALAQGITNILVGGNADGRNNFHWLAEQIVAAVGSIPGSEVHVVEAAIATAVADEIDRRDRERLAGDSAA